MPGLRRAREPLSLWGLRFRKVVSSLQSASEGKWGPAPRALLPRTQVCLAHPAAVARTYWCVLMRSSDRWWLKHFCEGTAFLAGTEAPFGLGGLMSHSHQNRGSGTREQRTGKTLRQAESRQQHPQGRGREPPPPGCPTSGPALPAPGSLARVLTPGSHGLLSSPSRVGGLRLQPRYRVLFYSGISFFSPWASPQPHLFLVLFVFVGPASTPPGRDDTKESREEERRSS